MLKISKRKISPTLQAHFVELQNKVMQERAELLKKLTKSDLVTWAAYLETTLFCERIVHETALAKRKVGGGMQNTEKALTSKVLVPKAIDDLVAAGLTVTEQSMKDQIQKYPELQGSKTFNELISENAIKQHLKNFNKTLRATSS